MSTEKKLWLAIVEHEEVPGDRLKLYFQPTEPEKKDVLDSFAHLLAADEKPQKLIGRELVGDCHVLSPVGSCQ